MRATSSWNGQLEVVKLDGNWVCITDKQRVGWTLNVDVTRAIAMGCLQCTEPCIIHSIKLRCEFENGVWRINAWRNSNVWVQLDLRLDRNQFIEKLRTDRELAIVARIYFALRKAGTEIDNQLTPINGDYTSVLEALESHRQWALEPQWLDSFESQ